MPLALIDGHSFAYRAFYGLPRLSNRKGQATQAVFGFAGFLTRMLRDPAAEVVVVYDPPGPTFRHEAFKEYKVQRKPTPPELVTQFPLLAELVEALGVPRVTVPGFEADDVLATLALRAAGAGTPVVIYSGDKDLLQLVRPGIGVAVPAPKAGATEPPDPFDAGAVREKWGVGPNLIRDLLALMGDTSDNIPGVPGVGPVRAAELLNRFGSVDGIYAHVGEIVQPALRANLIAAEPIVRRNLDLVSLRTDVAVPDQARRPPDAARLRALYTELEFTRLLAALPAPAAGEAPAVPAAPDGAPVVMLDAADAALVAAVAGPGEVLLAATGDGGLALAAGGGRWRVDAAGLATLAGFLADPAPRKVVADGKSCARLALETGLPLAGVTFDIALAAGLLGERPLVPTATEGEFPAVAAARLLDTLADGLPGLKERLEAAGMAALLRDVELPATPVLAAMERTGIRLDTEALAVAATEIRGRLAEIEAAVRRDAGTEANLLSPRQVGELLFQKLNLPAKKKTKTGFSTDEAVLEELSLLHPVPGMVLEFRKLSKLLGTYLEPLPGWCDEHGLLHTRWNQLGAATGRLSSSDPNLQNIPVRGEWGRRIRAAFIPRAPGRVLISADYSQIELRLLAHIAHDGVFLEAFARGEDVHAVTAGEMFGRPPAEVTSDQRRAAKAVNFGILYGMSAYGLARELKTDPGTAKAWLERWFDLHPAVKAYWDDTLAGARAQGWVATMFGRRRLLPEIAASNRVRREEAEREAINHPIQGAAADLMKLAIAAAARAVPEATLLLTIHDELLFEAPADAAPALAGRIRQAMEGVHRLSTPLVAEAGVGPSWAACHP